MPGSWSVEIFPTREDTNGIITFDKVEVYAGKDSIPNRESLNISRENTPLTEFRAKAGARLLNHLIQVGLFSHFSIFRKLFSFNLVGFVKQKLIDGLDLIYINVIHFPEISGTFNNGWPQGFPLTVRYFSRHCIEILSNLHCSGSPVAIKAVVAAFHKGPLTGGERFVFSNGYEFRFKRSKPLKDIFAAAGSEFVEFLKNLTDNESGHIVAIQVLFKGLCVDEHRFTYIVDGRLDHYTSYQL